MSVRTPRPQKGQRYRSLKDLKVNGVVTFSMPFTGSFQGVLPKGEILVVEYDPPPRANGVYLQPENFEALETRLIPHEDRTHPKYDSFAISATFDSLEQDFERLNNSEKT